MKIKDHFLSKEIFEIKETEIEGIFKTYPIPENLGKYYESKDYISHHQDSNSLKEKIYKFAQSFNLNYKRNILSSVSFENAKVLDYGCGAGEFLKHSLVNIFLSGSCFLVTSKRLYLLIIFFNLLPSLGTLSFCG